MTELRKREGVLARAIEFAILTACRSDEVSGARWSEIDLDARLWMLDKRVVLMQAWADYCALQPQNV